MSYDKRRLQAHRRLVVASLLRSGLTVILLVICYYLVPLDHELDATAAVELVLGLLGVGGVFGWQIRAIIQSDHPRLRAIEGLATGLPLFLLLFSLAYSLISKDQVGSFSEPLSRTDALYFTVTVFSTVGFGDITPKTDVARIVTTVQMILDLVAIGAIAKITLGAVEIAMQRRSGNASSKSP